MRLAKENLGKVSVTIEKNYHSSEKEYDKLVVVEEEGQFRTFISRKPVPIGTELTDREFWLPFSSVKESIVIDYNKFKQYIRIGEGLLDDSIVTRHIKDRNVTGNKIAEATITFVNIADEAVTLPKINKDAIDTTLTKEGHLAEAKHTGERLLNVEGLSVVKIPVTESTVLDAWQIVDKKGNVHGVTINTYKDKSIDAIWLSVNEDDPQPEDPEVKVDNPRYLNIVYNKADGTQQKVSIPLASFVTEAEFSKNGFKVIDGVVNLKISSDITTSKYLHFDVDGNLTIDGFEERVLEDLGSQEHSQPGDGTMWGEFKEQEIIREQISNSAHQVFSDNWDTQDDDPDSWEDPIAVESSYAYNWKSEQDAASDGKTQGNLKDLYQKNLDTEDKLTNLALEIGIINVDKTFSKNTGNQMVWYSPTDGECHNNTWLTVVSKTLTASTIAVGYFPSGSQSEVYRTFDTFNVGDSLKILNDGETLKRIVIINVSVAGAIYLKLTNRVLETIDLKIDDLANNVESLKEENFNINKRVNLIAMSGNQLIYGPAKGSVFGDVYVKVNESTFVGTILVQYYDNLSSTDIKVKQITPKIGELVELISGSQVLYNMIAYNATTAGVLDVNILKGFIPSIDIVDKKTTKYTTKAITYNCLSNDRKLVENLNNSILDVCVISKVGDAIVYIEYILRNANIGGTIYNSVNFRLIKDGVNYGNISSSNQGGNGIELINIPNNDYIEGSVLINWDLLPNTCTLNLGKTTILTELGKTSHLGLIDLYRNRRTEEEFTEIDKMYVYNGKVVCNNDHKNASNVVAKYASVDMGANIKKVMCKFTTRGGSLALITTKRHSVANVTDITAGSVHLVYTTSAVKVGVYAGTWNETNYNYSAPLTANDSTEYEVGFEFLGNNKIRLYMPDKTTKDVTVNNADDYNGRYLIFEHYVSDRNPIITNLIARPSITGIFCSADGVLPLQDNFMRENGVLTISPSGHIYRLFRNYVDSDGRYDMSNGVI